MGVSAFFDTNLFTEDLNPGQNYDGGRVVNPFS
jgi:hypothetical protein